MTNLQILSNMFENHFECQEITFAQLRRASKAFWAVCDKFSISGNEDILMQVAARGIEAGNEAI